MVNGYVASMIMPLHLCSFKGEELSESIIYKSPGISRMRD
jgi:hypothetical protein